MSRTARILTLCAALLPQTALALSCGPWSPAQAYGMADAAASQYSVVVGRFQFDAGALPNGEGGGARAADTRVPAVLTGRALSRTGFVAAYSKPVTLAVSCAASWCGAVTPGQAYLVFVEHGPSGLTVDLGACATVVFPNPTAAVERDITRCLTSSRCSTR